MKQSVAYVAIVTGIFLAVICAPSEARSGHERRAGDAPSAGDSDFLERTLAETGFMLTVAELLESNRIRDAKALVAVRLDGRIIAIDEMIPAGSPGLQRAGTNLLQRLAEFRRGHPVDYHGTSIPLSSNEIVAITAKVDSILEKHRR